MVKEKEISNAFNQEDVQIYSDYVSGMTPLNLSKKYHKKKSDINDRLKKIKGKFSAEELELFIESVRKQNEAEAAAADRDKLEEEVFEMYKNFTPIVTICKQNNISMPTMYGILYKKAGGKEIFMEKYARQKRHESSPAAKVTASVEPDHTIIRPGNMITAATATSVTRPIIKPVTPPSPAPAAKPIVDTTPTPSKKRIIEVNNTAVTVKTTEEDLSEGQINFGFGVVDIGEIKTIGYSPIYCELIAGRHYTANKVSIFDADLNGDQLFDFDYQEKKVEEFIEKHVKFNSSGKAENKLVVYLTGLQSAWTSVINVCYKRGVPIEAMHYNTESKNYVPQKVVLGTVDSVNAGPWKKILGDRAKNLWFVGCDPAELQASDTLYAVVVQKFRNTNTAFVIDYNSYIIVNDFSKLWEVYGKMVNHVNSINSRLAKFVIFAKPLYYNNEYESFTLAVGQNLAKTFNYGS